MLGVTISEMWSTIINVCHVTISTTSVLLGMCNIRCVWKRLTVFDRNRSREGTVRYRQYHVFICRGRSILLKPNVGTKSWRGAISSAFWISRWCSASLSRHACWYSTSYVSLITLYETFELTCEQPLEVAEVCLRCPFLVKTACHNSLPTVYHSHLLVDYHFLHQMVYQHSRECHHFLLQHLVDSLPHFLAEGLQRTSQISKVVAVEAMSILIDDKSMHMRTEILSKG